MAEGTSRSGSLKRAYVEDDESSKPPPEKRVRFPKGKKVKKDDSEKDAKMHDSVNDALGEDPVPPPLRKDPRLVARDRAVSRHKLTNDLADEHNDAETFGFATDVRRAEVQYQDNEAYIDEGVTVEPFNLEKEREEGYFDDNGNYVEYVQNDIKDAWLDSVDTCAKYVKKSSIPITEEKPADLSTEELAEINRRITDVLEPGETVLRALRRLKGSTDKRQKMSAETKHLFDRLTEDAMRLMENGDYNVYDEKQEHFAREAEGYEKLVKSRNMDMFGDDEETATETRTTTGNGSLSVQAIQSRDMQSDYVYDEASGYYYNSTLGYYYDPSSGLYGCAATAKWYSYNEESGAYDEVQEDTNTNAAEVS